MDASPSSDTQTPAPATSTTTIAVSPITTTSLFSELLPLAPLSPPSSVIVPPAAAHNTNRSDNDSAASEQHEQESQATAYQRKRAERMFSCENMKDLDRDLRITGATKKGSSWQYHIEVLDTRVRMPSFADPGCLVSSAVSLTSGEKATTTTPRDGAADPVEGDASYAQLPPMVRYSVMRRYNDFRQLVIYLSDTYGPELLETLPKFPEGGIMSYIRGDDPRLLKYRKEQLQKFLRALDEHPHLKWCKGLTHFLRPDILELTTIGGMFQTNADTSSGYLDGGGGGFVPQPPTSSSGYVSLSLVKSPEIRFSKQLTSTDGRGDWKRRRVPFPIWGSGNGSEIGADVIVKKRVSLTEEEDDDDDDEGNSDNEENVDQGNRNAAEKSEERVRNRGSDRQKQKEEDRTLEQQKKATQLMKLLSLEPSTTAQ